LYKKKVYHMIDCCFTKEKESSIFGFCPSCNARANKVNIITIKSMLKPSTLNSFNAELTHYFCSSAICDVVYFDTDKRTYLTTEIK
ncbi:hypothetical protein R0J90_18980, partial [Micrococcus sp. SIMBA_144]